MMAKRDKREQRIRQNPRTVRFADLDAVLRDHEFDGDDAKHHVVYQHTKYPDLTVNVPKPHGGVNTVKATYVRDAIRAIDEAERRDAS